MIQDIEGKEINVGDECYCPAGSKLVIFKIIRETNKTIFYKWKMIGEADWRKYDSYIYKSSTAAHYLIKIC